jgi:hypothetical protein
VSRNAAEFGDKLRELLRNYVDAQERLRASRRRFVAETRGLTADAAEMLVAENLEAHTRAYLVDGVLAALGWKMTLGPDPVGQLLVEQPIREPGGRSTKYMDYLGIEGDTDRAVMVVETKRPGANLPTYDGIPPANESEGAYVDVLARGLANPEKLGAEWSRWLIQVRGYARAVRARCGAWPERVVVTNGDWMIIFEKPEGAFGEEKPSDATAPRSSFSAIRVVPRLASVYESAHIIYQSIAYRQLVGTLAFWAPAQLPFYISAAGVDGVLHGIRVFTGKKRGHAKIEPTVYVKPLIFLRTLQGGWFRVHEESEDHEFEVPYSSESLGHHLATVDSAARALLEDVNHHLSLQLTPTQLEQHCASQERLAELPLLVWRSDTEFELVTGDKTHYLLEEPRVPNCQFHNWQKSKSIGHAATEGPVLRRSVDPKSFFYSGEEHYCSHRAVLMVKSQPLTQEFIALSGLGIGKVGDAFCRIFQLDHHLCCQVCVLHDECRQSEAFRLPCHRAMS